MRSFPTTPPLVPAPDFDLAVHIVLDDFGKGGRAYQETDEEEGGLEAVIENLMTGQYNNPIRVVSFNTSEGWALDVSEDICWELLRRIAKEGKPLAASSRKFVVFYVGEDETLRAEAGLV